MSPVRQWPVSRQRHATGKPGIRWPRRARRQQLTLSSAGQWALLDESNNSQPVHLLHAWPAFAWMTLRFHSPVSASGSPFELTINKSGLGESAWRELRICVARQLAMPQRAVQKEHA